jgi:hypothetical protein
MAPWRRTIELYGYVIHSAGVTCDGCWCASEIVELSELVHCEKKYNPLYALISKKDSKIPPNYISLFIDLKFLQMVVPKEYLLLGEFEEDCQAQFITKSNCVSHSLRPPGGHI